MGMRDFSNGRWSAATLFTRNMVGAVVVGASAVLAISPVPSAQTVSKPYALEVATGLRLHNVTAEPATLDGKRGLRVRFDEATRRRLEAMTPSDRDAAIKSGEVSEPLAVLDGLEFGNGVIEADVAGTPRTDIFKDARGFVGIAFRVQKDLRTYDAFYLRPTNGRAEDQERRNHSVQYISHPEWTWNRFRNETPSRYESYVDLVPGAWTKVRIEIRGTQARLFVHDQPQPTLIVNDLKTGAEARGAIALWIDVGTVAHFRNLRVRSLDGR
jgi:hypothetical protein